MTPRHASLAGRVVLITGASAGIGAATARAFAGAGASVVLAARSLPALEEVARTLPGQPLVAPADVADQAAVQEMVARAVARHGHIDILVNNAGVGLIGPVEKLDLAAFERALAVDLFGPLYLIQAALPHMRIDASSRHRPQIIQVSSVVGLRALPYLGGYAAAKGALERLSEALRVELRDRQIAVTVVRPGTTATSFREHRLGSGTDRRRVSPRGVPPERVAAIILRAAIRRPRVAYVSWSDRLMVAASLLLPAVADRLLRRIVDWRP